MTNGETKSEELETLEGIVRSVDVDRGYDSGGNDNMEDLFVLIDKEGVLYNTVLRGKKGQSRLLDKTAMRQIGENIHEGDKIRINVIKDDYYTQSLPLYGVMSQYTILERTETKPSQ